ncbi:hypothetical protein GGR58DRAFT_110685 [Xylaria digitata]|nr:hypothetical protein GGR58DRAFT_110685 [Xylaria digitata]
MLNAARSIGTCSIVSNFFFIQISVEGPVSSVTVGVPISWSGPPLMPWTICALYYMRVLLFSSSLIAWVSALSFTTAPALYFIFDSHERPSVVYVSCPHRFNPIVGL